MTETASTEPVDARRVVSYLIAPESDDYIAVVGVLEDAGSELTPAEVAAELQANGHSLDIAKVEERLTRLRTWGVVTARQDNSEARIVADLLARNWRYALTLLGRNTHRFYRGYLSESAAPVREIAFNSLKSVIAALRDLAEQPGRWDGDHAWVRERVDAIFTNHDALDASLVGSEDALLELASRYDLDDAQIVEFKQLLIGYVTRAVDEIETGAIQVLRHLRDLEGRFGELAEITVTESPAAGLIRVNAISVSKGGQVKDWAGLLSWYGPGGRPDGFVRRIVAALPTFHANLRRSLNAGGSLPVRARAVIMAQACQDAALGRHLYIAALGDHPWRKLHGETEEPPGRMTPWRNGPQVEVAKGLRTIGRASVRGQAPAPRDDAAERAKVAANKALERAAYDEDVREILGAVPGQVLSERAGRLAFRRLLDARQAPRGEGDRRTAGRDGLAVTLFPSRAEVNAFELRCATFRAVVPGWTVVFHPYGTPAIVPADVVTSDGGRDPQIIRRETAA